ncbi:unnamed protein product [Haemonchus placei]|uniref:G_PROTEIN_RECEP_F1_2 domain-containing protein n=1 Tax=Haemonchus placei TaxID=6290 RepID=A0A0N4WLW8_HAEPC|nr:unnamed protein product [Haemonchus placei]
MSFSFKPTLSILGGIYTYFFFFADNNSYVFMLASQVLRPFFQWLSLLSSSLNPLIYIAYSQKYRRAFHKILLLPCRSKYERVRGTLLRSHDTQISEGSEIKKVRSLSEEATCMNGG